MNYQLSPPHAHLKPFIRHYWSMDARMPASGVWHRVVPTGLTEWTFYLADIPMRNNERLPGRALAYGQQQQFFDLHLQGQVQLFAIVFQPMGMRLFLKDSLIALRNAEIPLDELLGPLGGELTERLHEARHFGYQKQIADELLLSQLRKTQDKTPAARLQRSFRRIHESYGQATITHLADDACMSRKQYERIFAHGVGSSPKQFLRTIRFQASILAKERYPALSLTQLAHQCGYYDQAHMITDYKKLTGFTPRQYFANGRAVSDYFIMNTMK